MSQSLENNALCEHRLCLGAALRGKKYCRAHILTAPETIKKAHTLLHVEIARVKDYAAREELYEAQCAYLYAVRAADAIKFGRTFGKLEKRISALQTGCPVDLVLVASLLGPAGLEPCVHWYLKPEAHMRGEWFRASHPKVLRVVELMIKQAVDELSALIDPFPEERSNGSRTSPQS